MLTLEANSRAPRRVGKAAFPLGQTLRRSRAGSRREARLALLLLDTAFSSFHDFVPSGAGNGFT